MAMSASSQIDSHTDNHAMTEVALGLAMAFFAMMILAMVSMSVVSKEVAQTTGPTSSIASILVPADSANSNATTKTNDQDLIIIYHQDQYFDVNLQPINLDKLPKARRYVLAMAPNLPFSTVISARAKISASNLIITELDQAWLTRLAL